MARIQRAMEALMQPRRPPPHVRQKQDLGYRVTGPSVEIFEIRPAWRGPADEKCELKWHGYEPRPEVNSVDEFASLVAEDAHACFFG